jgi:hypothetical protein
MDPLGFRFKVNQIGIRERREGIRPVPGIQIVFIDRFLADDRVEKRTDFGQTAGGLGAPIPEQESGRRLIGFGHRVYKNHDPRARIVKQQCVPWPRREGYFPPSIVPREHGKSMPTARMLIIELQIELQNSSQFYYPYIQPLTTYMLRPFTAVTRVRIPLGSPIDSP